MVDLQNFLDEQNRVKTWPKKHSNKLLVLEYLVSNFETGKVYSEKEVNDILKLWHTFEDWPLLRRALIDACLLTRDREGREYRRPNIL